ncbi:exo-poly-alpha-galacturonosidase [Clostridium acetobutylicum]|uniref:Polygalacturonase n=1 Tax=Clostridium acetobutylicum (strain ATCC 824 / DSM 792 / JCM 1419 / IAM 19013 / LMG 5710 / NBRC 13948 / NRRL B-527 / VKM B-1787 / 2291 / W) TaxID=272562 RepID=Q97D05_CLOAB|nr:MULTISPECIES: glycoside hydrolase family 28 protein [Clostridium]AAK81605.1 Polygalacturonase [Clostridium acetobutylicum ATCC 824]ADZ22728.1 Polygalacturonase [Clostridium acetobutylicum EA 2018]AEI34072.1 polygalacturonase [Clostridium acetobutylicum DSM 1731]AWV80720.1 glycoside hydrolase family 28 protein [Clostridium acetobutylicum]MBC2393956.1 glycoside hydrolase family 28 protein [Clostridium acetobutylicum]
MLGKYKLQAILAATALLFNVLFVNVNGKIVRAADTSNVPQNVIVPDLGYSDSSITLIWDKPTDYSKVVSYDVYVNNSLAANTKKLNYTVTNLKPNTAYSFKVRAKYSDSTESEDSSVITQSTTPTSQIFDVTKYGAVGDGKTLNTDKIQAAINACTDGGTVVIPQGTFLSGAIYLKSNMSLRIDGTLLGSDNVNDYAFTSKRFPYYTTSNYMGLINAYTTNYGSISNVKIYGNGTVSGGTYTSGKLTKLGQAQTNLKGDKARGDLITAKGVTGLYLGGVNIVNPSEHSIFISYSKNVTVDGISVKTYGIHNADGIDIANTSVANIFNSYFDNGDDCINLNAGYGADAVKENIPDNNIRIFNSNTGRGHGGVVFGSYTGAWIQNVSVEDCDFNGTNIGLRFKTSKEIGGGARNITVRDVTMENIVNDAISFDSNYGLTDVDNPAPVPGYFHDVTLSNIMCKKAGGYGIWVNALPSQYNANLSLNNITLNYCKKGASINYLQDSTFTGVKFVNSGNTPWASSNTTNVKYINCTPQP